MTQFCGILAISELVAEVRILWLPSDCDNGSHHSGSSWAGVSLLFSLHSASHTHCLLEDFVSHGSSNSDTLQNLSNRGGGDLDMWHKWHRVKKLYTASVVTFKCPSLLWSTLSIFWKNKTSGQYFLPTRGLAIASLPKGGMTFKSTDAITATNYFVLCLLQLLSVPMRWERYIGQLIVFRLSFFWVVLEMKPMPQTC